MSVAYETMSFNNILAEVKLIDLHDGDILDEYLDITRVMFESLPNRRKYQDLYYRVVRLSIYLFKLRLDLLE
jgi:hypothetical protein